MMKRLMAALAALCLLLAACAAAETGGELGDMVVVNCEEWVSLRSAPSTKADRLIKVPLGAPVSDCSWAENGFIYGSYGGYSGYIKAEYLAREDDDDGPGEFALDTWVNGLRVTAERAYVGDGEYMLVICEDQNGGQRWSYETMTSSITELDLVDCFIGGAAQDPMVMVYNAEKGLTALDIFYGEPRWTLTPDQVSLGASISHAVSGDGTLYVGGYYGPDPVAIDLYGHVLWQSDVGDPDIFWLYEIQVWESGVAGHYACTDGTGGNPGWILFNFDGTRVDLSAG